MATFKKPCYFALAGANYTNGSTANCPVNNEIMHKLKQDQLTVSSFINSESFVEQRKLLQQGKWPKGCASCAEREDIGVTSHRLSEIQHRDIDYTYYDFDTGHIDPRGLRTVELRFSNLCNMACLHCNDTQSSRWESALNKYTPDVEDRMYGLRQLDKRLREHEYDQTQKLNLSDLDVDVIVDDLIENFVNLERIDFAGGEVLYQKIFFRTLRKLHEHPNAHNLEIFFHTNFNANFNCEELAELLKPFGSSTIKLSIDSSKRLYPYFRNGDWDTLENNIRTYKAIDSKTKISAVITTGIHQVMDLHDVFMDIANLGLDNIHSSIISFPQYLNPSIVRQIQGNTYTEDYRQTCESIANMDCEPWYKQATQDALDKVNRYVVSNQPRDNAIQAFHAYTRKVDKMFSKSFNTHMKNYEINDDGFTSKHV